MTSLILGQVDPRTVTESPNQNGQTRSGPYIVSTIRALAYKDKTEQGDVFRPWHLNLTVNSLIFTCRPHKDDIRTPLYLARTQNIHSMYAASIAHVNYLLRENFRRKFAAHIHTIGYSLGLDYHRIARECLGEWDLGGINMTPDVETPQQTGWDVKHDRLMTLFELQGSAKTRCIWETGRAGDELYLELSWITDNPEYRFSTQETMVGKPFIEQAALSLGANNGGKAIIEPILGTVWAPQHAMFGGMYDKDMFPPLATNVATPLSPSDEARLRAAANALAPYIVGPNLETQAFGDEWMVPQIVAVPSRILLKNRTVQVNHMNAGTTLQYVGVCNHSNQVKSGYIPSNLVVTDEPSRIQDNPRINARPSMDVHFWM